MTKNVEPEHCQEVPKLKARYVRANLVWVIVDRCEYNEVRSLATGASLRAIQDPHITVTLMRKPPTKARQKYKAAFSGFITTRQATSTRANTMSNRSMTKGHS